MMDWTPMMRQYYEIKRCHTDAILFFRMGDFYEMFGEDARVASSILEIALTSREKDKENAVPMCGVPHHAADAYIGRLLAAGHKVAICEQVEEPSGTGFQPVRTGRMPVPQRKLLRREVVQVVTPGTVLSSSLLPEKENHYLGGIFPARDRFGLALLDYTTGEFLITEISEPRSFQRLQEEFSRFAPVEVLVPPNLKSDDPLTSFLAQSGALVVDDLVEWAFDPVAAYELLLDHFHTHSLEGFGCEELKAAITAGGAVLYYLKETQKRELSHITKVSCYSSEGHMILDAATQCNLELVVGLRNSSREGSLLEILDRTVTPMGGRKLKQWVLQPLLELEEIEWRQQGVEEFFVDRILQEEARGLLKEIGDMERIISKVALGAANARDLLALSRSLRILPPLQELLSGCPTPLIRSLLDEWDCLEDVLQLLEAAIDPATPLTLKEGGLIRQGYSRELDDLRAVGHQGKNWIARMETRERERTGIPTLKVGYNRVFGYYLEVTQRNIHLVPSDYQRKQTLANAERFVTPELKEWEARVLGAEERIVELEYQIFQELRERVAEQTPRVQKVAHAIAQLDVLAGLARVALDHNYIRPRLDRGDTIRIIEGRHPVVERFLTESFIPNDTLLDCSENQLLVITGPNMAGKSTYLRQVALIVLLAQVGSFVPAQEAHIGVVDRIFTRVGAHDNLVRGQSTFMVEMNETSNILHYATCHSLVILDEIGRGTSTFDGISLAWAIAEYLHDRERVGAKTLFATHYHELTELEQALERARNYNIAVRERGDKIVFLRRIVPGGTDKSYGIQVARLAGLPAEVLERAREVLDSLENGHGSPRMLSMLRRRPRAAHHQDPRQLSLFVSQVHPAVKRLKEIEVNTLTPLEALNLLAELKQSV